MTFASFIVGFPGETEQTVQETVDFIRGTKPDYYRAQMWYCEPGTPIYHERDKFKINGDGFVWTHETMSSLEAMDQIERMFLTINESSWLPQWSFDFWVIPYLIGRGLSPDRFKAFMGLANKLLALEIASVPRGQKDSLQREYLQDLTNMAKTWTSAAR
jgi:p-methyltransferase